MRLPAALLDQLSGTVGFDRDAFLRSHQDARLPTSIRLNPAKLPSLPYVMQPIGWADHGYYLSERPSFTFDPLFHAGTYYVQEASSMLLEQAVKQFLPQDRPLRVLDLCAAPGGKATHLYSLLPPNSFLVANEVIRSRALVLRDNLIRWGVQKALVTQNDPEQFSALENYFDWVTVDAPCSGSGLFRKDPDAIEHWSPGAVQHCSLRQQRIVSAAWQTLRPGGILFYSTCSYSTQENEEIPTRLIEEKGARPLLLSLQPEWNITPSSPGYRCWPDKAKGEGFYFCCLQKPEEGEVAMVAKKVQTKNTLSKKEEVVVREWIEEEDDLYFQTQRSIFVWPRLCWDEWHKLINVLNVIYSGFRVGQIMGEKLVPDHALALSKRLHQQIPLVSLTVEEAILYLQRKPLSLAESVKKGWCIAAYQQHPLGWINILSNRVNNYYPKELRILKESLTE